MAQAYVSDDTAETVSFTATADYSAGDVVQLRDGRAGVVAVAVSSGGLGRAYVSGRTIFEKPTTFALLPGLRLYWDHSANAPSYKKVHDRDFYLGRVLDDAAQTAVSCVATLNIDPPYDLDLFRDPYVTAPVGTQALGGFLPPQRIGGGLKFVISATNEAQKSDALSKDGFAPGAKAIVEAAFAVVSDGAGTVVDVSIGVANATHATDADSIAESLFVHLDANNTNINAESDDGTTEVAATDTTTDYTEGATNRKEVWFDLRDNTDIGVYVDGVQVLTSTVFKLNAATGPLKLLVHVEKTASTDTYELDLEWLRARFME